MASDRFLRSPEELQQALVARGLESWMEGRKVVVAHEPVERGPSRTLITWFDEQRIVVFTIALTLDDDDARREELALAIAEINAQMAVRGFNLKQHVYFETHALLNADRTISEDVVTTTLATARRAVEMFQPQLARRFGLMADRKIVRPLAGPVVENPSDPGEWLIAADAAMRDVPEGASLTDEQRAAGKRALRRAMAAIEQVLEYIPAGAAAVPAEAFTTDAGRAIRQNVDHGRFERRRLESWLDRCRASVRHLDGVFTFAEKTIVWKPTGDRAIPWQAEVDGERVRVRVRDEDPRYIVLVGDEERERLAKWPRGWTREKTPEQQQMAKELMDNLEANQKNPEEFSRAEAERLRNLKPPK